MTHRTVDVDAPPIVFLDFDGVLALPQDYWVEPKSITVNGTTYPYGFSREPVQQLNQLLADTEAIVVVSSSWRRGHDAVQLAELLIHEGVENLCVLDTTPVLPHQPRGREIRAWLKNSPHYRGEPFVILDDDDDMVDLMPHLVHTDYRFGLTEEHRLQAMNLLRTNPRTLTGVFS